MAEGWMTPIVRQCQFLSVRAPGPCRRTRFRSEGDYDRLQIDCAKNANDVMAERAPM
jgi:hypothetical protein